MINIKEATITDAQVLALLGRVTFVESHGKFINNDKDVANYCNNAFQVSKIKEEIEDKNILFWLIFYDELPVGFAKVMLNTTNEFVLHKKVCKLDKIYILNDFIGKKLGLRLHQTILKKVQELQFDAIWLVTYILNYKAIDFYESHNYKKTAFIDFIVADKGYKNHILVKKLRE